MNDSEKIKAIKEVFKMFHDGEDENGFDFDTIDAMMRIESILER